MYYQGKLGANGCVKEPCQKFEHMIELYVKSLKEGQNYGFDPSLGKLFIKSSLARRILVGASLSI